MTKSLIDKNEAFSQYFGLGGNRSLKRLREKLHQEDPDSTPSIEALKDWSVKYSWQNQVMLMDKAVSDGLKDRLVPSWVELKAELIEIMLNQIRAGVAKGLEPENVRDMTALTKELRAMVGDDITKLDFKADLGEPPKIEFIMYDRDGSRSDGLPEHQPEVDSICLPNNNR